MTAPIPRGQPEPAVNSLIVVALTMRHRRLGFDVFYQSSPLMKFLPPLLGLTLLAGGCTMLAPQHADVDAVLPERFELSGSATLPALWWQSFADPQLDALVATALSDNPGLQVISARLQAAEALARSNSAALWPRLSASATENRGYGEQADTPSRSAGLAAAYEVDLWGRIRAGRDAGWLQAEATAQELQAARISLSANVAVLWFQIGSTQERLGRIEKEREVYERVLRLVETRFRNGQAPVSDVLRQRQLVESTASLQAATTADLGLRKHALQELLGQPAGAFEVVGALPRVPPTLPATGVPATVVNRRPDVQQAWLQVLAADRTVAAAIANRFPQLSLNGSYGSNDAGPGRLFDQWLGSLVGTLDLPLLDGGARRAEVDRSRAVLDQRLAEYRLAVLAAFREIADALLQDQQLQIRVASLDVQLQLSDQVVDRLERQLRNGGDVYLNLLDAQITNSSLRRDVISTRQLLVEQRIALLRALAGPLPDPPPAPAASTSMAVGNALDSHANLLPEMHP